MRLVIVISVLSITLVYCVHIDSSDNEQNESLDKRITPELNTERSLIHRSSKKILQSLRKESPLEKHRRRCDSCRETIRCKIYGKCELCTKVCKEYEAILVSTTEAPLLGSIHADNDDAPATEVSDQYFTNPDKYYTIGSFGAGAQQNLLVRLLNIVRKDSLDKLIILAKPKGQEDKDNQKHPIIIDTANVFKSNITGKEFATEVHTIDGSKVPKSVDLELTSKIDRDLDAELKRKQKIFGKNSLSPAEIDRIIERALLMFNYKPISQRSPLHLRQRDAQLGSRNSFEETSRITTRRSIPRWKLLKSNEETMEDSSDNNRHILSKEIKNKLANSQINNHTFNNQLPNKRTILNPADNFLGKVSRHRKFYPYHKSTDECINSEGGNDCLSSSRSDSDPDASGEMILVRRRRPLVKVSQIEESRNGQSHDSIVQPLDSSHPQVGPEILSVPIDIHQHLESDSQLLESTLSSNPETETESSNRNLNENFAETVLSLPPPAGISNDPEEDSNLGMADKKIVTSESFLEERRLTANKLDDTLQISDRNLNIINASHFTLILKDLERKVENIADLVKKTCGKESKEAVTEEVNEDTEPVAFRNPLQDLTKGEALSSVKPAESPIAENRVFITDTPYTTNSEGTYQTKELTTTQSLHGLTKIDEVINRLNQDTSYLVDKALNIAQSLPDVKPTPLPDNILSRAGNEPAKIDEEVGCSKEGSEEYVGNSGIEGVSTSTLSQTADSLETRSNFGITTVDPGPKLEETVACSKEDTEEYVGKANEHKNVPAGPELRTQNSELGNEEVGCSKESDEYIARVAPTPEELHQVSTSTHNLKDSSTKTVDATTKQSTPIKFSETTHTTEKEIINQKILSNNNEDVGCSKGESEEYVGERKGENIEKLTKPQEETVGCSKEKEDYEYVPTYPLLNTYRIANDDSEATKPHLSLPMADEHIQPDALLPSLLNPASLQKTADTMMPSTSDIFLASNLQSSTTYKSDVDENFAVKTTRGNQGIESAPIEDRLENSLQEQDVPQDAAVNRELPDNYHTPITDEIDYLPSSESTPQYTSEIPQPKLSQRFSVDEHPPEGIERGFMQLPNKADIVGVGSDLVPYNNVESIASTEVHTLNPFSIFGRVVPQLRNGELSDHQVPSDSKIYFVGSGMQLPLNMQKDKDGSYKLSVDIDRLCNKCKGNTCNIKTDDVVENRDGNNVNMQENTNGDSKITPGLQPQSATETQNLHFNNNQETISEISKNPTERYISKRKIGSYSSGEPVFQNKVIGRRHINKSLSNYRRDRLNQQNVHPILDVSTKEEIKQSEISKRSPSFHFLFPNLKNNHQESKPGSDFDNYRYTDEDITATSSTNSLYHVDESLKKIDKNMKKYYDRRYKLEDYYKNQNKKYLHNPDESKDLVKRKVTLVNNVLSWMKNIAIQNAHS